MNTRRISATMLAVLGLGISGLLAGCSATAASSDPGTSGSASWATATSAEDGGGMDALVEAAKEEGSLNVMGLYPTWANYGGMMEAFTKKYGIKIENDTSQGSSQDQINAIQQRVGQDRSLDYLDTGVAFAETAAASELIAAYRPAAAEEVSDKLRGSDDRWTNQYGGYLSIGCDTAKVKNCPTSFADLKKPEYKGQIGAFEDPTSGELEFNTVWAMSMANGGSLTDIQPGVDFVQDLMKSGNMSKVVANDGTIERGETPIVISWDYLNVASAQQLKGAKVDFEVNVPTDVLWSAYYAASINADAPHPAAARLWLEFIFSDEGQNLFLEGATRPIRLEEMQEAGTIDKAALDALPPVKGTAEIPTQEQREAAKKQLTEAWQEVGAA